MMKRTISLLISLSLMLSLLTACQPPVSQSDAPEDPSSGPSQAVQADARALIGLICASCGGDELEDLEERCADEDAEWMSAYIENAYGLQDPWEDAAVARAAGASAFEIAVVRLEDEAAAARAVDALTEYLTARERDFTGYAPAEADMASNGRIERSGAYVGLFICPDTAGAAEAFQRGLSGEEEPAAPTESIVDDVDELLEVLLSSCEAMGDDIADVERIANDDKDELKSIIEGEYGLTDIAWEEASIARGTDGAVFELAILRFASNEAAMNSLPTLVQYLDAKEKGYARFPAQAEVWGEAAAANPDGTSFVVMAVCSRPDGIIVTATGMLGSDTYISFQRNFNASKPQPDRDSDWPDRVAFSPPNEDDMSVYDTSAIRAAWEAGDPAGLSEGDEAVYDAAQKILGEIIREGMTDLEKEEAVYRWLVDSVDYDWRHQDVMMEAPRTAYEPYGALVDRMAVCLGYATGFQLLMDLTGVECITVVGACFNSTGDHAWNMVRLDGQWYCVDVTWDANGREQLGEDYEWRYFNITSAEMAKNHQWDYANTPEATAEDHGW